MARDKTKRRHTVRFPFPPMEATSSAELPTDKGLWQYEPKWDGFRCLAFSRDGKVELQSKSCKALTRYFPEVVSCLERMDDFVLDGELVIPIEGKLSFDALLQRIHPAESRIQRLSQETPARFIVFDLLLEEGRPVHQEPLSERRRLLEVFAKRHFKRKDCTLLSPIAEKASKTKPWLRKAGNALDGIIAKRRDLPYRSGLRDGMVKVKTRKSADCVVGGFRYASKGPRVGSLLLGLYDDSGMLNHVGFVAASGKIATDEFTKKLEKLRGGVGFSGNAPGRPSRWSTERSTQWEPLRAELVVEVEFDHLTGGRFRHGTKFLRWRPDKDPKQCTLEQVVREQSSPLALL